eukprot:scaffold297964_cov13-Tisochrysis_lutea.AAC.1
MVCLVSTSCRDSQEADLPAHPLSSRALCLDIYLDSQCWPAAPSPKISCHLPHMQRAAQQTLWTHMHACWFCCCSSVQCEALGRELVAARQAKERTEADLRQQVRARMLML